MFCGGFFLTRNSGESWLYSVIFRTEGISVERVVSDGHQACRVPALKVSSPSHPRVALHQMLPDPFSQQAPCPSFTPFCAAFTLALQGLNGAHACLLSSVRPQSACIMPVSCLHDVHCLLLPAIAQSMLSCPSCFGCRQLSVSILRLSETKCGRMSFPKVHSTIGYLIRPVQLTYSAVAWTLLCHVRSFVTMSRTKQCAQAAMIYCWICVHADGGGCRR